MLKVIGVTDEGHAVVDTSGLFRIKLTTTEEVVEEFVEPDEVEHIVNLWEDCGGGLTVRAEPYRSVPVVSGLTAV